MAYKECYKLNISAVCICSLPCYCTYGQEHWNARKGFADHYFYNVQRSVAQEVREIGKVVLS